MNTEGSRGFEFQAPAAQQKVATKETTPKQEDKTDRPFVIDLAAFLKNQKKAEIQQRLIDASDESLDPFALADQVNDELAKQEFTPDAAIFNLKKLLKDDRSVLVGNKTLRLTSKGSGLFVSLEDEGAKTSIEMGLMEFLTRLDSQNRLGIEEAQTLFDTTLHNYLHPEAKSETPPAKNEAAPSSSDTSSAA